MKVVGFVEIDGYKIVSSLSAVGDEVADPEATRAEIAERENIPIDQVFNLDNYDELFEKYKVPSGHGPEKIDMEDSDAAELIEKFNGLNQNQRLLITGEVIPDFAGKEYYLKVNGKWEKRKIEKIGEAPEGPLEEYLTQEEREVIRTQEEEYRICCMTPEERAEAMQRELDALADEAARLEKRAQIQGSVFDPAAWYQEREQAVREKYSVTQEA
ncbi:MAG: hypothetical protein LBB81_11020 [Treponema sp.]|jgi:hypothetical protein|nr:hypothetical protein [Treponema sp.]